jgi:hypothetical protein
MTKKHFIALADALRAVRPVFGTPDQLKQWARDVEAVAEFCAGQNGLFKRDRWMGYIAGECGPCGGSAKAKAGRT